MKAYDFRSDTVSRPTREMLRRMSAAELGDDVLGDDPTVIQLEQKVAEILGKEAALFVPSGTMSNLLAVYLHCKAGEEMICESQSHIYVYEQAGYAQINGVSVRTISGNRGLFTVRQLREHLREPNIHFPETSSLSLENTHNRGGGKIWPLEDLLAVCEEAKKHGLTLHLDGARLMNAVVASGVSARQYAAPFETVSLCLSKGLGCPVGSILAGSSEWIHSARRRRKVLGGGMRQAGILAAAGLYALEHHLQRLREDHENAQILAEKIRDFGAEHFRLTFENVETNMVFFEVVSAKILEAAREKGQSPAAFFSSELFKRNIRMNPTSPNTLRAVTHLDVDQSAVLTAADAFHGILREIY